MTGRKLGLTLCGLLLLWLSMLSLGGPEARLDRLILDAMHRSDLVPTARILTLFGNWPATTGVTLAAAAWLAWKGLRRPAVLLMLITFSGRAMVELQKFAFARARPDAEGHLVAVHSLSFPSGHAANATLVWLCLALLLPRSARARTFAIWGAVWLSLAVGLSRVVLGVHWPSDVIGGWAFGLFWTMLLLRLSGHSVDDGTLLGPAHSLPKREGE